MAERVRPEFTAEKRASQKPESVGLAETAEGSASRRRDDGIAGRENRREKPETMKKAPETGAFDYGTCLLAPIQGAPKLLLFLGRGLFLRGGFLSCALHRLILP